MTDFLLQEQQKYAIILASGSPRRQDLLRAMGFDFRVELSDNIEENFPADMPLREVAAYLAQHKSHAFSRDLSSHEILITADTVVLCGDELLGKPKDYADALRMLSLLSGKEHEVLTAVCLRSTKKEICFTASAKVCFLPLQDSDIEYYINRFKPYDKAGAYGIQEWIGYIGISRIEGSFYTIMGLPTSELYQALQLLQRL